MKNIFTEEREIKRPTIWHALISMLGLIAVMMIGIVGFGADPHIPMFIGVIITSIVSMTLGYKWADIEQMMIDGISKAMQSMLILAIVGMMVGAWLLSGTIPTMIYYGLKIPALPTMFLGSVMGLFCMGVVQHIPFSEWFTVMHYGYTSISEVQLTDDYMVADIVGGGGFDAMLWTISVCFASMCFAGALECTGMLSTTQARGRVDFAIQSWIIPL